MSTDTAQDYESLKTALNMIKTQKCPVHSEEY